MDPNRHSPRCNSKIREGWNLIPLSKINDGRGSCYRSQAFRLLSFVPSAAAGNSGSLKITKELKSISCKERDSVSLVVSTKVTRRKKGIAVARKRR